MRPLHPIGDDELATLFAPLNAWPVWLLAVSGGPDSLALMHLIARWQRVSQSTASVSVATVDHGLRATSADEAVFVATQAKSLGLPHVTLPWLGDKPSSGIINAARVARYDVLIKQLASLKGSPRALITAHHQDDQAETVLMRLARGSGVDGLAAMAPVRLLDAGAAISLVRPLLGLAKTRLEDTLSACKIDWIDDPSNTDLSTERARLRIGSTTAQPGNTLPPASLALTARRMAQARDALNYATSQLAAQTTHTNPGVSHTIARAPFNTAPFELRVRLMARALFACGGAHPPAMLAEIEALVERLNTAARAVTLGGCRIDPTADHITICREPGRIGLPQFQLQPGDRLTWDNRFQVFLSPMAAEPCVVRALTHHEWLGLKQIIPLAPAFPQPTPLTIPSFWASGELIAVPSLNYASPQPPWQSAMCQAIPSPKTWHAVGKTSLESGR